MGDLFLFFRRVLKFHFAISYNCHEVWNNDSGNSYFTSEAVDYKDKLKMTLNRLIHLVQKFL